MDNLIRYHEGAVICTACGKVLADSDEATELFKRVGPHEVGVIFEPVVPPEPNRHLIADRATFERETQEIEPATQTFKLANHDRLCIVHLCPKTNIRHWFGWDPRD